MLTIPLTFHGKQNKKAGARNINPVNYNIEETPLQCTESTKSTAFDHEVAEFHECAAQCFRTKELDLLNKYLVYAKSPIQRNTKGE